MRYTATDCKLNIKSIYKPYEDVMDYKSSLQKELVRMRTQNVGLAILSGDEENIRLMDLLKSVDIEQQLIILHQVVEETLSIVGADTIEKMLEKEISSDIFQVVREYLFQVYVSQVCIESSLTQQVLLEDLMQPISELVAWYKEGCEPYRDGILIYLMELYNREPENKKKILAHMMGVNFKNLSSVEIEEILGKKLNQNGTNTFKSHEVKKLLERVYEKDKTAVKRIFHMLVSLLQDNYEKGGPAFLQGYDGEIHMSDYRDAKNLVASEYFLPDDWMENFTSVGPVFSPKEEKKFPLHIRERVREMYRSFIFGNWMSVTAMGRSLLEYIIIDRKSSLKIEVYEKDYDGKERPKKISRLVDLAAETNFAQSLKEDMKKIVQYGNEAMHPIKTSKIKMFPHRRQGALDCIKSIIKIIQVLY